MDNHIKLLTSQLGELRVKHDIDVSEFLETRLGSKAKAFYLATTREELIQVVTLCRELQLPYLLVGSGSKVALAEEGFEGVVIKNRSHAIKISGVKGKVSQKGVGIEEAFIEADSGVSISKLIEYGHSQGLGGLEAIKGLPGTTGGNLYTNATLQSLVHKIVVLDRDGEQIERNAKTLQQADIILATTFKLKAI